LIFIAEYLILLERSAIIYKVLLFSGGYMNTYYEAILQASEYIEENLTQDMKVQDIIHKTGFSQYHFMRLFKAISGHTISNYIKRRKMTEASKLLLTTDMRILDLPEDLAYQKVNSGKYAVFSIPAVVENVPKSISEIYAVHLPASGLKATGNYDFEYYDYSFEVNNENSFISFYVPIE